MALPPSQSGAEACNVDSRACLSVAAPGAVSLLHELVTVALQQQVTEIHVGVGECPRFREAGELQPTEWPITREADINQMLREILSDAQLRAFIESKEYTGAYDFGFVRSRINLLRSPRGSSIKLRLITPKVPSFSEVSLLPEIRELTRHKSGLIPVTGPPKSGKTSTVAGMIDHINHHHEKHILTLEDPIVFVHQNDRCLIRQRDLHLHTRSLASAMRGCLREDVDVIVLDELFNREMIVASLEASQHGQLVLATLQTNSFSRTADQVLNQFLPGEQARIRRAMTQSLLAEIAMVPLPRGQGPGYRTSVNRQAYRDYKPLHREAE